MRLRQIFQVVVAVLVMGIATYAIAQPQDNRTRVGNRGSAGKGAQSGDGKQADPAKRSSVSAQPILDLDDSIPDSLLHPRWKVQRTMPITESDLTGNGADLRSPDNIGPSVAWNDTTGYYVFGTKMGGTYVQAPLAMTYEEYLKWSERQMLRRMFRQKNALSFESQGKEQFDFTDMHFDLGPAEKIFGQGGVRITTQGTAELKFGATMKHIDNPSLPIKRRKTTSIDFEEKINFNMTGKVGDKVNMGLNYNTDATFDYDAQNMKLKYEGKEDEIIKLVEGGNISFPSNSSLITGATSLFGIRTDMQFGKLKLQTVVSQKKSSSVSASSKGGTQLTSFEIDCNNYEENRHFFLSQYFRSKYDSYMKKLPNVTSGISIGRVEIWVTNKTGTTSNTRDIIALTDLGENQDVSNPTLWGSGGALVPSNAANSEYSTVSALGSSVRDIDQASTTLEGLGLEGGTDFEKVENARKLESTEYTLNTSMGYVSLKSTLQTDQVLAIAYEYTYAGQTYQVGEFATDNTNADEALIVKSLKNTSNTPQQGNWRLMMKNVYSLASTIEKEKFRLDVKYQSDTTGVYLTYIPEEQVKDTPLVKALNADRLDANNKAHSNGYFDYVEGYTVSNGRVFFPVAEPFGEFLYNYLVSKGVSADKAEQYAFTELYDSTKTVAKQIAEKDKYILTGQFKGSSANVISLGTYNVPQGSVVVTAGGVTLTEGSDYSVNYSAGEVTILNQSIIDAGTTVNVSCESNTDYGQMRKTMIGVNWEYDFSKDFQLSGTFQHLSEQALTTKVNMGSEPLNNTLWGINVNWKKESQWLTNMLNKIPFLHVTEPSYVSFTGEFAQLIAGQSSGTQDNASYIDDFESTKSAIDVSTPSSWMLSSVPSMFSESSDKTTLASGYNRALLAWYTIDPLFTRRSSSLTPSHIKSDLDQLSNHYVREVYVRELYPNRDQSSYSGATSTLSILNLAYYPEERGPYNFNPDLNSDGTLNNAAGHWGGMMRKIDTSDFETANVEYIEFWMLDPFIYTRQEGTASQYGGDLYFNLGEVSEDILRDGKKFYESGMPVDGSSSYTTTQWGKIPSQATTTYAFATTDGSRELQDVGLNGLTDEAERSFSSYQDFLTQVQGKVSAAVWDSIYNDPANDDYHYFRGSDLDLMEASILRRYKRINNPQGNSPDSDSRTESYDTSYKTTPDVEDINQDYTLNEYEKYYQYRVSIRPEDLVVGQNFIVDKRTSSQKLRNGNTEDVDWYQFRIPVDDYESKEGSISDFSSIRFMRMFMTNFEKPIILRFGSLDLVRGEWRVYEQSLDNVSGTGELDVSAVNIEENNDKTPVNYTLPPGIRRAQDPTQPQLVESNEQALCMTVTNLSTDESKCVYKNATLDIRQYKRLQMYVHANALEPNSTSLADNQLAVFVRLGSDYKSNYYEYEIPLTLTPAGHYDQYSTAGCTAVWPEENMLDIRTGIFTDLKKERNKAKSLGLASYTTAFSVYDEDNPNNKVTVMGNPSLGEVKVMIIGVRNKSGEVKSGEVWVNELRLKEYENTGGWAAQGNLNVQLSDFGTVNAQGRYVSQGFGGLEDGVAARSTDDYSTYTLTTSLELGKFFPDKARVTAPLYYSVSREKSVPKYNPFDTDMLLEDALDACATKQERDSLKNIAVTKTLNTNLSLSGVRVGIQNKKHPTPIDPANFTLSYSHSHKHSQGETTVYENEDTWNANLDYSWTPVYKALEPWKKSKSKSKWLDIAKQFSLNWMPQNVSFSSDLSRSYYELQERDLGSADPTQLPVSFSSQFLWNRVFSIRWDLTKNIHVNFSSATNAEIEEPYTAVNKDLYPDRYEAWKDSVWTSIRNLGTPLDYNQSFSLSVQSPLDKLPILDWTKADASYKSTYTWTRGTEDEDGTSYGNTITSSRDMTLNGTLSLEKLYNHVPFLKKANERFSKDTKKATTKKATPTPKTKDSKAEAAKGALPTNKRSFEKEIRLMPDTSITVSHGKKSRRLTVRAKTADGKAYPIKYKVKDDNTIRILNKVDTATNVKISVMAKEPLEDMKWYRTAQTVARVLMMARTFSFTYRQQQAMSVSGFQPMIGDAFGQKKNNGYLSPGLGFAFGLEDESLIDKALERDWLVVNDSLASPATISRTEDLQLRLTIEPIRNFKVDLNASRTQTKAKSIQYMYEGMPTTHTGMFSMTTISLGSAFESTGNANNGYKSKSFEKFCNSLDGYRQRVEALYANAYYPSGSSLAGQKFSTENGTVDKYSADVMIPAFLSTYTSMGGGLDLFPTLARILPNWSVKFSGLQKLPWLRDHFKSVNLNHSYKSIYAVGSYSSYSTWQEYMNGLGFVTDATTSLPVPSSMYNISTVSINEAFSPLLGIDMTFLNNMTLKVEYRQTRVLSLSMTSVQINESTSKDWVLGWGYKIQDFKLFGSRNHRKVKSSGKGSGANDDDGNSSTKTKSSSSARNQLNHDLNLRVDFSFRRQAAIIRDIATVTSTASSGNSATKLSLSAEYTLSRLMTMSFYYDMQRNVPLLSSSSYPTTTRDFGLSLKFSLKR